MVLGLHAFAMKLSSITSLAFCRRQAPMVLAGLVKT